MPSVFDLPSRPKNFFKGIRGSTGRRKSMMTLDKPLQFKGKHPNGRSGSQKRKDRRNRD